MDSFERVCVVTLQPLAAAADFSRANVTPLPNSSNVPWATGSDCRVAWGKGLSGMSVTHRVRNKAISQPSVLATIWRLHNSTINYTAEHFKLWYPCKRSCKLDETILQNSTEITAVREQLCKRGGNWAMWNSQGEEKEVSNLILCATQLNREIPCKVGSAEGFIQVGLHTSTKIKHSVFYIILQRQAVNK